MIGNVDYSLENKLIETLNKIVGDPESIFGIMTYADTDEDRKIILDFIETGKDVDAETITVLAIGLDSLRNGE